MKITVGDGNRKWKCIRGCKGKLNKRKWKCFMNWIKQTWLTTKSESASKSEKALKVIACPIHKWHYVQTILCASKQQMWSKHHLKQQQKIERKRKGAKKILFSFKKKGKPTFFRKKGKPTFSPSIMQFLFTRIEKRNSSIETVPLPSLSNREKSSWVKKLNAWS